MANRALESQQTTESASAETSHHSQHDPSPCGPDGFIAAPYPPDLQTQQVEEAAAKQKPNTPQTPQHHEELQQESVDSKGGVPTQGACNSPIVILVMGLAGCGKTSFIEKAIGYKNENVAANIHAEHDRKCKSSAIALYMGVTHSWSQVVKYSALIPFQQSLTGSNTYFSIQLDQLY